MPPPSFAAREREKAEKMLRAMQAIQDKADEEQLEADDEPTHSNSNNGPSSAMPEGNMHSSKMFSPSNRDPSTTPPPQPNSTTAGGEGETRPAAGAAVTVAVPNAIVARADSDIASTVGSGRERDGSSSSEEDGCASCDPLSWLSWPVRRLYQASLIDPLSESAPRKLDPETGRSVVVVENRSDRHRKVFAVGCGVCSVPLLVFVILFANFHLSNDSTMGGTAAYVTVAAHGARVFFMMLFCLYVILSRQASDAAATGVCFLLLVTSAVAVFVPEAGSLVPVVALLAAMQLFRASHRFIFFSLAFVVAVLAVVSASFGTDDTTLAIARFKTNLSSSCATATTLGPSPKPLPGASSSSASRLHWSLALLREGSNLVFLLWLVHGCYCYVEFGGGGRRWRSGEDGEDGEEFQQTKNSDESHATQPRKHNGGNAGDSRRRYASLDSQPGTPGSGGVSNGGVSFVGSNSLANSMASHGSAGANGNASAPELGATGPYKSSPLFSALPVDHLQDSMQSTVAGGRKRGSTSPGGSRTTPESASLSWTKDPTNANNNNNGTQQMPVLSEQRRICVGIFHIMEVLSTTRTAAARGGGSDARRGGGGGGGAGGLGSVAQAALNRGSYTPGQSSLTRSVSERALLRRESVARDPSSSVGSPSLTSPGRKETSNLSSASSQHHFDNDDNGAPHTTAGGNSNPPRRSTYVSVFNTSTEGAAAFLDEIMRIIADTDGYVHSIIGGQIVVSWNAMTNVSGRMSRPPDHCAAECVRLLRQHRHENRARRQLVCCGAVHGGQGTCIRLRGSSWAKPGVPAGIFSAAGGGGVGAVGPASTPPHSHLQQPSGGNNSNSGGQISNNSSNTSALGIPIDSIFAPWFIIVQHMSQRAATLGIAVASPAIYQKVRMQFCLFPVDSFVPGSSSASGSGGVGDLAAAAMVLSEVDLTMSTKEKFLTRMPQHGRGNRSASLAASANAVAAANPIMTPGSFSLKRDSSAAQQQQHKRDSVFSNNSFATSSSAAAGSFGGGSPSNTAPSSGTFGSSPAPAAAAAAAGSSSPSSSPQSVAAAAGLAAAFSDLTAKPMTLYSVVDIRDDDTGKYVVQMDDSFNAGRRGSVAPQRGSTSSHPSNWSMTSHPGGATAAATGSEEALRQTSTSSSSNSGTFDHAGAAAAAAGGGADGMHHPALKRSDSDKSGRGSDENSSRTIPNVPGSATNAPLIGLAIPTVNSGSGKTFPARGLTSPGGSAPSTSLSRACDCAHEMVLSAYDGQLDRMDGFFDAVRDSGGLVPDEERELLTAMHDFAGSILRG